MRNHPLIILSLLLTSSAMLATVCDSKPRSFPVPVEQITLYDAEILIYLLPQAQEVRKEGMDIAWELQTSPKLNQDDFYTFWVTNAKRKHVNGSVIVGFFSVNKHTADVLDNLGKPVTSPELAGVRRILREAHHIDSKTIQKYESRNPHVPSRPPE